MDTADLRRSLREMMHRYLGVQTIADGDDIFASGIANSLFAMQLVEFIENAFGIRFEAVDLEMDNFCSIDAIVQFVERKFEIPRRAG